MQDLLATYPKPYESGTLQVLTTSPVTNLNQSGSFPALSPVAVSSTPSFSTLTTASVTSTTPPAFPKATLSTTSASIPRAHSPTMRSHSPTPSAESSGPAQFVLLPGEEDPNENRAPQTVHPKSSVPTSTNRSSSGGMRSNIAQSYVGVVNGASKQAPVSSVSNAPASQIKLQPGFDFKPKTAIAQSYVGVVTPTARASTSSTTSVSSSITTTPQIRVQSGMEVKPHVNTAIAQSYVGVVNMPVSATNHPTSYNVDHHDGMAVTTSVVSTHSTAISYPYHSDSDSIERKPSPSPTMELYYHDYSHHRRSYAEALTTGDALESIDFGMPESSSYLPPQSSDDFGVVSGDTAPPRRAYEEEPRVRAPQTATHSAHEHGFTHDSVHKSGNSVTHQNTDPTMQQSAKQQLMQLQTARQAVQQQQGTRQAAQQQQGTRHAVQQQSTRQAVQQQSTKHTAPSVSINSTVHSSTNVPQTIEYPSLKSSHSQKSVQFAEELTKEYRVNTKKPITKSKTPLTVNDSLKTKPILTSPKVTTAPPAFTTDTRANHNAQMGGTGEQTNQKPSLANRAWAKPTVFAQMASAVQKKDSPSFERKPVPQAAQTSLHRAQAQILTTGRAPAQQTESGNGQSAQDRNSNVGHGRPAQRSTLPPNWTPGFQGQNSDSSNPSLEDLHLYTMPDLGDQPPALPPRNGEKSKQFPRNPTSLGSNPSRMSARSASSLPRSSAFGPPISQSTTGLERRTLSNQALTGHLSVQSLARASPTPSVESRVSTRRDIETTFGSVAETAHTGRLMPQAQVAHTGRRTNANGSHVGVIETNL